nr:Chain B, WD repeat-containing protein 22 [Homo sapiens]
SVVGFLSQRGLHG